MSCKPPHIRAILAVAFHCLLLFTAGCTGQKSRSQEDFSTSGSREADQRASQRMAKSEQLAGAEENGEEGVTDQDDRLPLRVEGKLTLFDRLGGDPGISSIVADFVVRAMEDPRVNWERAGIERGLLRRVPVVDWEPTAENIAILTKHIAQFLALASGGPARYDGRELETTHADMRITNPEFDAVIGDLKATLDKLKIPAREQKELLAIVESTRPQIVTER